MKYDLEKMIGKTIQSVECSEESYEDTWAMFTFTDGTKFKIRAAGRFCDELWLDVSEVK